MATLVTVIKAEIPVLQLFETGTSCACMYLLAALIYKGSW